MKKKLREIGAGSKSTISISNTKNKTASKKNRSENGIRAEALGSNPHSKGDIFSLSFIDREDIKKAAINTTIGIIIAKINAKRVKDIPLRT